MDAAVVLDTPPVAISPILPEVNVILSRYRWPWYRGFLIAATEMLAFGASEVLSRCVNRNIFYIIGVIVVIVIVLKLLGLF
jgi:hypothetical protein